MGVIKAILRIRIDSFIDELAESSGEADCRPPVVFVNVIEFLGLDPTFVHGDPVFLGYGFDQLFFSLGMRILPNAALGTDEALRGVVGSDPDDREVVFVEAVNQFVQIIESAIKAGKKRNSYHLGVRFSGAGEAS